MNKNIHPMVAAAEIGNLKDIEKELAFKDFSDQDYVAALSRAGGHGHLNALKLLASSPYNRPEHNEKALKWAARHGKLSCVRFYIEELKVPATAFNSAGLRIAAQHGKLKVVTYLAENGGDITAHDNEAIKYAVRYHHDDVGEFLIMNGANPALSRSEIERTGRDVVYQSSTRTGNFDIDQWDLLYRCGTKYADLPRTFAAMLKRKAELAIPQVALDTALQKVASYGLLQPYKVLREHGACVNSNNVAALSEAARFGHEEMVTYILHNEEFDRETGIQRALKKSMEVNCDKISSILMLQIENDASIENPVVLLERFLRYKQFESAKALVQRNVWMLSLESTSMQIIRYGNTELVKEAIRKGMQVLGTDENYVDAAIERFNFDVAELLIEEGLMPKDVQNCLVQVAKHGRDHFISYFLTLGARADANNSEALRNAAQYDHINSAKILRAHGAKTTEDMLESASEEMRDVLTMSYNRLEGIVQELQNQRKLAV